MGEEADALEEQSDGGAYDDMREIEQQKYYEDLSRKKACYEDNKRSQVGATIRCANCRRSIVKKSYQTQFCSNKGKGNCKDTYWNNVSDKRRYRSHIKRHNKKHTRRNLCAHIINT